MTSSNTVTAGRHPADDTHTTRIGIDCQTPVRISGLGAATGYSTTGAKAAVSDAFAVEPATADCTASPVGTVTAPDPRRPKERLLSAQITAGTTTTVTVTCTDDGRADGTEEVDLTAEEPGLSAVVGGQTCAAVSPAPAGADAGYRCVLSDEHRLVLAATADAKVRGISIGWSASGGAAVSSRRTDAVAAVAAPNGELTGVWRRAGSAVLECTADGSVTVTAKAGSGTGAVTHVSNVSVVCEDQGAIADLENAVGAGTGTVTVSDVFTVTPAAARCTASSAQGKPKVTEGIAGTRTVSMGLAAVPGRVVGAKVSVDCTPPGHAPVTATAAFTVSYVDSCDDPLGTLADGVTTRSGTIAQNPACVSPQRVRDGGSSKHYPARRHTFTLANPATVRIDVGPPTRRGLDAYVVLLEGHSQDGTGTVAGRDNNSGPRNGARLTAIRLAPGDYTIEATTAKKRRTGGYDLRVDAQLDVLIANLNGNSIVGTGTANDHFTVLPADAACTSNVGIVTDPGGGRRILSADLTTLGDTDITVTCRRTGYGTSTAASTLTALTPVSDVTVEAASGGTCKPFTGPLEPGVDRPLVCTMTRGAQMTLSARATGFSSQTVFGWAAATGVRVVPALEGLDASVVGDAVVFTRTGTGTVTCTTGGDITVTALIWGTVHHTTTVSVTCEPPVEVTDYVPGSRNGAGPMTGTFRVVPATAQCKARHADGIPGQPAPGGTGTSRTVSVTTTTTGWLDIEVECSKSGYATDSATARFRADDDAVCATDMGTLGHGTRTQFGTIAQHITRLRCKSFRRDAADTQSTYYVQRYTFTMATSGWVSVDLDATGTGQDEIDPYVLLLYGHGSGGAERARDDNSGAGDNARLTDLFLAPGEYTIEATTATAGDSGKYRLSIDADFTARAPDQLARIDARVGQAITRAWAYLPAGATAAVQAITPSGLTATVTSDQGNAALTATASRAGDYTVTVAYAASGHTSTIATAVKILCPPRHVTTTTRTCTPLATALPAGCTVTSLNTNGYWGANTAVARYSEYSTKAPAACESLSEPGAAAYFRFTVPDRPGRLPVRIALDSAEWRGTPGRVHVDGGQPSLTLWQEQGGSLSFHGHASAHSAEGLFFERDLAPGQYVAEVAPSRSVSRPHHRYRITATVPTGQRQYAEVQRLGHIGSAAGQLTLAEFVRTRAQDHGNYPYLNWTSDQCSTSPDEATYNTLGDAWIDIGLPRKRVLLYHACWRHDFNWRNLTRIQHHVDARTESWTDDTREQADERIELDMRELCDANLPGSAWAVARFSCYRDAAIYRFVISKATVSISSEIGPPERIE
ncbi:phospholipase A2 [Candidatus Poriferisodalis sp.]|uniref:phospholipase A2 n=1 Tax=Candidatus Poriferisodalis sp. TaxID=3101277 RepID=UPI003B018855